MDLTVLLIQQMSVYLVIAYLASKTPLFKMLAESSVRLPHKIFIYLVFSTFCMMGNYFGEQTHDAIANTRSMGAVLGGLLGGPVIGFLVGLTGGLHRYNMGGFASLACAISTTLQGLSAGLLYMALRHRGRHDLLFNPLLVLSVTIFAELLQKAVILLIAKPFDEAWVLTRTTALPMLLVNPIGTALFMSMIRDRKTMYDKLSSAFTTQALKIAERSVGKLSRGFNEQNTATVARIIKEETGVSAVAITDRNKLLAFIGIGDDHHLPGTPIASEITIEAIRDNKVVFADGVEHPYTCSISKRCRLGASLVIPLCAENEVIGTIKLYERRNKLFLNINRTLGEGIARLLSNQILYGRLEEQMNLITRSELKLLQAQVNPHFLFNALNTISAITRRDPNKSRELLQHLAQFLRQNLKGGTGLICLANELDHIDAYLMIEKARFADQLEIKTDIAETLKVYLLPTFTLQPIVENAVKHGTSQMLGKGIVSVSARLNDDILTLVVEDNAGLYCPDEKSEGLGLNLVHKRTQHQFGQQYGLDIQYKADTFTRVSIRLPAQQRP